MYTLNDYKDDLEQQRREEVFKELQHNLELCIEGKLEDSDYELSTSELSLALLALNSSYILKRLDKLTELVDEVTAIANHICDE